MMKEDISETDQKVVPENFTLCLPLHRLVAKGDQVAAVVTRSITDARARDAARTGDEQYTQQDTDDSTKLTFFVPEWSLCCACMHGMQTKC